MLTKPAAWRRFVRSSCAQGRMAKVYSCRVDPRSGWVISYVSSTTMHSSIQRGRLAKTSVVPSGSEAWFRRISPSARAAEATRSRTSRKRRPPASMREAKASKTASRSSSSTRSFRTPRHVRASNVLSTVGAQMSVCQAVASGQRPRAISSNLAEASRSATWCPRWARASAWRPVPQPASSSRAGETPVASVRRSTASTHGPIGSVIRASYASACWS